MKVLVTGANGFLGADVCRVLAEAGHTVHGMVRASSALDLLEKPGGGRYTNQLHTADLADPLSLNEAAAAASPEAVVHCAAIVPVGKPDPALSRTINVEGTRALLDACKKHGCERVVHISSMSAQPDNRAVYGSTKRLSEEPVRESGMAWTILRPSLIYGRDERSVFGKMVELIGKLPVIPVLGPGTTPVRPMHVEDVAFAVRDCLATPATEGKLYSLGGADDMDVNTMMRLIADALGKQSPMVHIPLWFARFMAGLMEPVLKNPPFTKDNLEGVEKAAKVNNDDAVRDFGYAPRAFADTVGECVSR